MRGLIENEIEYGDAVLNVDPEDRGNPAEKIICKKVLESKPELLGKWGNFFICFGKAENFNGSLFTLILEQNFIGYLKKEREKR